MKKEWTLSIFLISLLTSCATSWDGKFYGLYGYYDKAQSENPSLYQKVDENTTVTDFNNDTFKNKVIVTNGKIFKPYLSKSEYTVVYIWSPKCKSYSCIALDLIQNKCLLKKFDLYVVTEYYSNKELSEKYNLTNNIIGIDTQYYKSGLTKKYLSKFLFDLTGNIEFNERYLFFKKGVYQAAYSTIEEIPL